jgi:hypothetical protein
LSSGDIIEFFGWLFAAWSLGFSGGYLLTQFKRAMDAVS